MAVDSVEYVEGGQQYFQRYSYADNNPYKYTDPSGEVLAQVAIGAFAGGLISGISYSLTTDNFSLSDLSTNVATGAAVGAVTAKVPAAIAKKALDFGNAALNTVVSISNAAAAGTAGNMVAQKAITNEVDPTTALAAGVANAAGLGVGNLVAKPAAAAATVKTPATPGVNVTSLTGTQFTVGGTSGITTTSEFVKQAVQDITGESASALINNSLNRDNDDKKDGSSGEQ